MKYFKKDKLVFIHIPKTAGGSINELLTEQLGSPEILGNAHGCLQDQRWLLKSDVRIFTSIRNPYDAAVSMYCSHKSANVMEILGEDNEYNRSIIKPARTLPFNKWLHDYYRQNRPPYSDYLLVNGQFDTRIKVVRFENLHDDLEMVLNKEFKLGVDLSKMPHIHKSERSVEDTYKKFFTDRASINLINSKYDWTFRKGFYKRL